MATIGGANLQGQDLIPSMPIDNTSNPSMGFSDFNQDTKNPLKSISHDLMTMPLKPMNMAGGMFSSSSSSLFGSRTISSASSCLQLSGSSSPSFDGLGDGKTGRQIAGTALMSATALLQKAAQMGATGSSNISPPMMQRSFVAGMVGPDQLSGLRPYVGIQQQLQQQQASYDQIQPPVDQSHLVGIDGGGFAGPFFDTAAAVDMFSAAAGLFMGGGGGGDQNHHGFLKNMENESSSSSSLLHGRSGMSGRNIGTPTFGGGPGGGGGGDMMTVDFLGIGGSRSVSLHEQQPQPGMEFETGGQQRLHGMHQFQHQLQQQQQQYSHGQSAAMEKHMWDV